MSHVTATGEKPPCALETATLVPPSAEAPPEPRPCALLCADLPVPPPAAAPTPPAPAEDESADPVGDGHSDAEFAEEHPKQ
jgi:hypothetical protein